MIVLLDAGPLGMVTNPRSSTENEACKNWLASIASRGLEAMIPEIADYEVRRELLRANKVRGLQRLDVLANLLEYLPLTTLAMRRAAELWAQARQAGQRRNLVSREQTAARLVLRLQWWPADRHARCAEGVFVHHELLAQPTRCDRRCRSGC